MTKFLSIILWWCVILSIFQSLKNSYSYTIVKDNSDSEEMDCSNGSEFQKECDCRIINGNNSVDSKNLLKLSTHSQSSAKCFEFCEKCPSNIQDDDRKKCEDKMPNCKEFANTAVCCSMKQVMNYSCEKTCKFCTDISEGIPGMPLPTLPGQPTMTTVQDPCNLGPPQPAPPGGGGGGGPPGGIPNPPAGIPGQG